MLELTVRRKPMRMAMMALSIVGAIDMLGSQNVGAVATNAAVVKEAVYASRLNFTRASLGTTSLNAIGNSSSDPMCATASTVGDSYRLGARLFVLQGKSAPIRRQRTHERG